MQADAQGTEKEAPPRDRTRVARTEAWAIYLEASWMMTLQVGELYCAISNGRAI